MSKFITFEGPEGAGKSTQITLLTTHLSQLGYTVHTTREPGGTSIGNQIRQVLHDIDNDEMDAVAEILLYSASRAQLVAEVIKPCLAQGTMVLCDRYADSTFAYQGYGRGLDMTMLRAITAFATRSLVPDLTIYLDLPVEAGIRRKKAANRAGEGELNRMDQQTMDFYRRVRAGYLEMAAQSPERWLIIDAQRPVNDIHREICLKLADWGVGARRLQQAAE